MAWPKISLILTTHNRDRYLGQALRSAVNQTYRNLQIVIIADGCTDSTMEVLEGYGHYDDRIDVCATERIGRVQSLILGHELSTGELVGWLDDDDLLAPNAVEVTAATLSDGAFDLVYTDRYLIGPHGEPKGQNLPHQYTYKGLMGQFITKHFRLFTRAIYEEVGGLDPLFTYAMDYDLCLRVGEHLGIYHLPSPLYYYRIHEGQISQVHRQAQARKSQLARSKAVERY
ncbi:glycosyltransferase [Acaryochloris sp. 'Moss Beach']|uniref:glycosyltransferase n=1 Tax=Acaryochloris sp. 'Moss Beach' TaxID=2740837 RepID=UPI001F3C66B0|nr:glycosyltransferase [Acaryochloris sp. 'Moss Beach']UJB69185.1 glycosyltransferase [Acaryochloris sp. 'Moss Beach']